MCRAIVASPKIDPNDRVAKDCKKLIAKFANEWDGFLNGDQATQEKMICESLAKCPGCGRIDQIHQESAFGRVIRKRSGEGEG